MKARVLVAGVGNILRGDDGFGPAVLAEIQRRGIPDAVRAIEVGIGGMELVWTLMDGFDAVIIVDAVERGSVPGTLHELEPAVPEPSMLQHADQVSMADPHRLIPTRSLVIARALGVLPRFVRIVGCQPLCVDDAIEDLSTPVQAAVADAAELVLRLTEEALREVARA